MTTHFLLPNIIRKSPPLSNINPLGKNKVSILGSREIIENDKMGQNRTTPQDKLTTSLRSFLRERQTPDRNKPHVEGKDPFNLFLNPRHSPNLPLQPGQKISCLADMA